MLENHLDKAFRLLDKTLTYVEFHYERSVTYQTADFKNPHKDLIDSIHMFFDEYKRIRYDR